MKTITSTLLKLNKQEEEKKDGKLCGHSFCFVEDFKDELISNFDLNKIKSSFTAFEKNGLKNIDKHRNTHPFYLYFSETAYSEADLLLSLQTMKVDGF